MYRHCYQVDPNIWNIAIKIGEMEQCDPMTAITHLIERGIIAEGWGKDISSTVYGRVTPLLEYKTRLSTKGGKK
jgi:hypothetical protein